MDLPIIIYTDGASSGNPGPGGYGIVMMYGQHRKEMAMGFRRTTNNRMELLAVIEALRAIKKPGIQVEIYTDSQYVVNAITKGWVFNWQKTGFKDKKNSDLWRQFLELYPNFKLKMHWVRGHAGNRENERCDQLATGAAQRPEAVDTVFERLGDKA